MVTCERPFTIAFFLGLIPSSVDSISPPHPPLSHFISVFVSLKKILGQFHTFDAALFWSFLAPNIFVHPSLSSDDDTSLLPKQVPFIYLLFTFTQSLYCLQSPEWEGTQQNIINLQH